MSKMLIKFLGSCEVMCVVMTIVVVVIVFRQFLFEIDKRFTETVLSAECNRH